MITLEETAINSTITGLPTLLSDIRVQLAAMTQQETLSSDSAGLLMMVGRLLTMLEADQQRPAAQTIASGAALLQRFDVRATGDDETAIENALAALVSERRDADTRRAVIDRYLADAGGIQQQRAGVAASDQREAVVSAGDPAQRFAAYLSQKAGRTIGPLKKFQRIAGGYSKLSIAVELEAKDDFGWGTQLIVRMDFADGATDFSVADEYPLLQRLHGSAVPVAKPYAAETDRRILGEPFLVSALLPGISARSGDPTVAAWGDKVALRRELGLQLARALGALHAVTPPEAAGLEARAQLRRYLGEWRQRWQKLNAPPSPALTLAFDWLEENLPREIARLAYIHGDFAPYNALQHQGHLTAVIDWEFVHLGDPAEDVGYCRKYMEALLPWDEFLATYVTAGGPAYRSDSAAFYEVWCHVRNAVVLLQSRQVYVSGRNRDIKALYAGAEFHDYFLMQALALIREQL